MWMNAKRWKSVAIISLVPTTKPCIGLLENLPHQIPLGCLCCSATSPRMLASRYQYAYFYRFLKRKQCFIQKTAVL